MNYSQLAKIKEWFSVYITRFHNTDAQINAAIEGKIHHTALVCDNIKTILQDLDWPSSDSFLAEAAGVLHDIGRFRQVCDFGTFHDAKSIDHGMLGTQILLDENILRNLEISGQEQRKLFAAVKWHNKYQVPQELPADEKPVLWLVRDADKLDIMRHFMDYYQTANLEPNPIIEFNLRLGEDCSEKITKDILSGKMGNIDDIRNLNDLRVIKLGWVFDLHYPASKKIFQDKKYIEQTLATIPATQRTQSISQHLNEHLEKLDIKE